MSIKLEVMRKDGFFIGAKFIEGAAEIRAKLKKQFNEEIRATEMSEVAADHLMNEEKVGKPRWFYAPGNYELFFTEQDGRVLKLEM